MKILPITNNIQYKNIRNSNCVTDIKTPINNDLLKTNEIKNDLNSIVFQAGINNSKKITETISNRISYVFNQLDIGEFLIISNNTGQIENIVKSLENRVKTMIEKVIIYNEPNIKEALFLYVTPKGEKRILNPNEYPIRLNGFDEIGADEIQTIESGDRIKLSTRWIEIKEPNPHNEEKMQKNLEPLLSIYDYSTQTDLEIDNHNRKILTRILAGEKPVQKENTQLSAFAKVGGQDENIQALKRNILFPLKYPEAFKDFMLSRGTLLYGPPGTGKTLLAQALIEESGASGFAQCVSQLEAKYVGESEQNCRELFRKAVDAQPSIIFLDEIDALGKARGKDVHGDKLLNQFLYCMSELEKNNDLVFVLGATNKESELDPALVRSGRFDLKLECKPPNLEGVRQIFEIHTKNKPISKNLNHEKIIEKMHAQKMTGADIASTVKNAYVNALERAEIYKSMEEGKYSPAMLDYFGIEDIDFEKAIESSKQKNSKRNPIGFNK